MMQTDVKSTHLNASGVIYAGRTRVRGILITWDTGTPTNHLFLYDNASAASGVVPIELDGNASSNIYMLLPGEGVLFSKGVYCDIGDAKSVTVFYG